MSIVLDGTSGITQMTGSIVMSGSTSGTTTIIPSAVAGTTTVTMPAATGTMMVSGNMPAFSAYLSSSQTGISNATFTKVALNTKYFDTNSYFDNSTNYRFTPLIAGYYQFGWGIDMGGTSCTTAISRLYKNGTSGTPMFGSGTSGVTLSEVYSTGSGIFYMNGSTDYVELYVYLSSVSGNVVYNPSFLSGCMIRAA